VSFGGGATIEPSIIETFGASIATGPASIAVSSHVCDAGEHTRPVGQEPSLQGLPAPGCAA